MKAKQIEIQGEYTAVSKHDIEPDPNQPRKYFDPSADAELRESILENGLWVPIDIRKKRPTEDGRPYRIIDGERRWNAFMALDDDVFSMIDVCVRPDNPDAFVWQLISGLQRQGYNPIEQARGFRRLMDEHNISQSEVARRVSKDKKEISRALVLLELPDDLQEMVATGDLRAAAARFLVEQCGKGNHDEMRAVVEEGKKRSHGSSKITVPMLERIFHERKVAARPKPDKPAMADSGNGMFRLEHFLQNRDAPEYAWATDIRDGGERKQIQRDRFLEAADRLTNGLDAYLENGFVKRWESMDEAERASLTQKFQALTRLIARFEAGLLVVEDKKTRGISRLS